MPIEEKLAEFLESYDAVLSEVHERYKPLLAEWKKSCGKKVPKGLKQKYVDELGQVWEHFSDRMKIVQIPLGSTAENFAQECHVISDLVYEGGISLRFGYFNDDFGGSDNYTYLTNNKEPMPGSTLTEHIYVLFERARRVKWELKTKQVRGRMRATYCNESEGGVILVYENTSQGKFWSPKLWNAGAKPRITVKCGEFPLFAELPYRDRMSITSAAFRKKAVGSGEIDAFLARITKLPLLETASPIPYLLR